MDAGTVGEIALFVAVVAGVVAAGLATPPYRQAREERSIRRFRGERRTLNASRVSLVQAAKASYPESSFIPGTSCLSASSWLLPRPIRIADVRVTFSPVRRTNCLTGVSKPAQRLLPKSLVANGLKTYSAVLDNDPDIRPGLFWNGLSYDLLDFRSKGGGVEIDLGLADFFEMVDISESLCHEFSVGRHKELRSLRRALPDFSDLTRHVNIAALTWILFVTEPDGQVTFTLHARDHKAVTSDTGFHHAFGGQLQPWSRYALDQQPRQALWNSFAREFAEELFGMADAKGEAGAAISFESEPLRSLQQAYVDGAIDVWLLGISVDPLSRWPSILAAAVCDRGTIESKFPIFVTVNDEGVVLGRTLSPGGIEGYQFTRSNVDTFCKDPATGVAAGGCLRLAWENRGQLGLDLNAKS